MSQYLVLFSHHLVRAYVRNAFANCLCAHPGLHTLPIVRLKARVLPEARVSITQESIL